ncbi:UNKNOWN [Stylonychia lemnae]|uniref:Uncharacterized protein n=1 Tax=Stylonychia lemnae TaxID=5949 RepID=A0A078A610_STYLE|nr:UNKNOWN [Stylonychia lemnae]|eukprot:CDW77634.1 UNKNOWN [Stylonychia lemnae]
MDDFDGGGFNPNEILKNIRQSRQANNQSNKNTSSNNNNQSILEQLLQNEFNKAGDRDNSGNNPQQRYSAINNSQMNQREQGLSKQSRVSKIDNYNNHEYSFQQYNPNPDQNQQRKSFIQPNQSNNNEKEQINLQQQNHQLQLQFKQFQQQITQLSQNNKLLEDKLTKQIKDNQDLRFKNQELISKCDETQRIGESQKNLYESQLQTLRNEIKILKKQIQKQESTSPMRTSSQSISQKQGTTLNVFNYNIEEKFSRQSTTQSNKAQTLQNSQKQQQLTGKLELEKFIEVLKEHPNIERPVIEIDFSQYMLDAC